MTTVFPMVRPQGYLEVRYLDGQPDGLWRVPIAAVAALMSDDGVGAEVDSVAGPTADAWMRGAQCGLSDPELRSTAASLLTLAADVIPPGSIAIWSARPPPGVRVANPLSHRRRPIPSPRPTGSPAPMTALHDDALAEDPATSAPASRRFCATPAPARRVSSTPSPTTTSAANTRR